MVGATARVQGVVFEEWPSDIDDAFVIEPGGLQTWLGSGQVRREDTARPTRHGSFFAPGFLSAKVTPITGHILAGSEATLKAKRRQLEALLVGVDTARMTVDDGEGLITWADVGLAQQGAVREFGDGSHSASFSIQVWSPDPFRFGELRTYGPAASVTAFHRGTVPAVPVIEVTGAGTAFTVTSPGGTYQVSGATAGGTHRIDMRNGWLYRDGVLVENASVSADTWSIPPGERWAHATSSGQVRVLVHDTYA